MHHTLLACWFSSLTPLHADLRLLRRGSGQTQAAESSRALGGGGRNPAKQPHLPAASFSEQQLLSCKDPAHPQEAWQFYHVGLESYDDYPFNE